MGRLQACLQVQLLIEARDDTEKKNTFNKLSFKGVENISILSDFIIDHYCFHFIHLFIGKLEDLAARGMEAAFINFVSSFLLVIQDGGHLLATSPFPACKILKHNVCFYN